MMASPRVWETYGDGELVLNEYCSKYEDSSSNVSVLDIYREGDQGWFDPF